jgi:hypothetical protein
MREHEARTHNNNSKRHHPVSIGRVGDRMADRNRSSGLVAIARVHNRSWRAWLESLNLGFTWNAYRATAILLSFSLFGIGLGLIIKVVGRF